LYEYLVLDKKLGRTLGFGNNILVTMLNNGRPKNKTKLKENFRKNNHTRKEKKNSKVACLCHNAYESLLISYTQRNKQILHNF